MNLVFPIKCFAMFFHINYIYFIIRNVTKNRLLGESAEFFFLRVNSIFKDIFFSFFHGFGKFLALPGSVSSETDPDPAK